MQVGKCTMHAIGENVTPKVERKNLVTFRNSLSWLLFIVLHSFFSVPVDEALHRGLLEDDTVTNQTGLSPTQVSCKEVTIPDCWRPILSHITTMKSPTHVTPHHARKSMMKQWTLSSYDISVYLVTVICPEEDYSIAVEMLTSDENLM